MHKLVTATVVGLLFVTANTLAGSASLDHFKTLSMLDGEWSLSPADQQEGGATRKGPAQQLLGTDNTAMSFKVIGKGSTIQENLLPGTGKEMATMYHCDSFKNCMQVQARHYCAKQNQPELVLDESQSNARRIVMNCDMNSTLCNSVEGHVHRITHELSQDKNHLKTTYTIFKDGKLEKHSIYHFDRKL